MGCLGIETHRIIHPSFSSLSSLWGISFPTQEGNRADIDVRICCTKTVMVQLCMSEGRAFRTAVPEPQQPLCSTAWQHPQPWQNYTQWDNGFPHREQHTWIQKGGGEDWHFLRFAKLPFTHTFTSSCINHGLVSYIPCDVEELSMVR